MPVIQGLTFTAPLRFSATRRPDAILREPMWFYQQHDGPGSFIPQRALPPHFAIESLKAQFNDIARIPELKVSPIRPHTYLVDLGIAKNRNDNSPWQGQAHLYIANVEPPSGGAPKRAYILHTSANSLFTTPFQKEWFHEDLLYFFPEEGRVLYRDLVSTNDVQSRNHHRADLKCKEEDVQAESTRPEVWQEATRFLSRLESAGVTFPPLK